MKYQAVLFDFDYTLGDSTEPIVASCTAALAALGWPAPEREAVRLTIGYTLEDGYTILTGDKDEDHRHQFFLQFKAHAQPIMARDTVLCPGAGEVLAWLKEAGIPAGIVSTKDSEAVDAIFRKEDLRQTLALIVGGRDVKKAKPDPEGLNVAIERLGIDKSHILFCGDTVIDAETARRAGVDFSAVLNGTTQAPAFADYPHVHIAPDLHELLEWLKTAD
jgi:phosphoglycolate phosphatase